MVYLHFGTLANGGNCPTPLTGARASLEIDANPMSFQKMGVGVEAKN